MMQNKNILKFIRSISKVINTKEIKTAVINLLNEKVKLLFKVCFIAKTKILFINKLLFYSNIIEL